MSGVSKEEKARIDQMQNDYEKVFLRTRNGKRVLKDILAFTGVLELSYGANVNDPLEVTFNEGRRAVGLKILEALDKKTYMGLKELEESDVLDTDIFGERK